MAEREGTALAYTTRVLRFTLIAPDIVEAILKIQLPITLRMDALLKPLPLEWAAQRAAVGM